MFKKTTAEEVYAPVYMVAPIDLMPKAQFAISKLIAPKVIRRPRRHHKMTNEQRARLTGNTCNYASCGSKVRKLEGGYESHVCKQRGCSHGDYRRMLAGR